MSLRFGAPLLAIAAAATLLAADWRPAEPGPVGPALGAEAPAFTLPRLQDAGKTVSSAEMAGQVWVLNVWASWCAPCRDEHPLLLSLARDSGVPLLGLNYRDDPRDAQEWLLRQGDPYVLTALDRGGSTGQRYGVEGVPLSLVIDRAGIVRYRHVGPLTSQVWAQELLPLIEKLRG
ncbi:MAG: DsbE family thiol:disulfide interchange protein [Rubrivivax sp.]|nr:DsbE family thiol:disulfide interchange protein [Rubrivivax sp.]